MKSPIMKKQELMSNIYNQVNELEICLAELYKEDKDKISKSFSKYKSYIKKIPKMIRKNGLILTFSFLNKKSKGLSKIESDFKILEKDSGLYTHIIETYLEFINEKYKTQNNFKDLISNFLGISYESKKTLNNLDKGKKDEIEKILKEEKKKRLQLLKENMKEYRELSLKTINFFDTYSIITDGFVSDYDE